MRIEIEIPKEFEDDYDADRFSDFFSRVICDIKDGVLCGNYEKETALMLRTAFHTSKIAYDVEAVIAELEVEKERHEKDRTYWSEHSWKDSLMYNECDMSDRKADCFETAISIVRGKGKRGCGNCTHQPEPFTTCDWLKYQTVVFKECPRWEGKE